MIIIPAIDIIKGKVVRLEQGDFKKEKVYSNDPLEAALKWERMGAKFLHIVDLDGAKYGEVKNRDIIVNIINKTGVRCEVGGGLRSEKDIEDYLKQGAERVVLGTKAFEDEDFLRRAIANFGEKIVVSVDFRNISGKMYAQKAGWLEKTNNIIDEFVKKIKKQGVKTIVVTDISRDGMLTGPNIEGLKFILEAVDISVVASGGVSSIEDIKQLSRIKGLAGVIVGRALYEGRLDLEQAIKATED